MRMLNNNRNGHLSTSALSLTGSQLQNHQQHFHNQHQPQPSHFHQLPLLPQRTNSHHPQAFNPSNQEFDPNNQNDRQHNHDDHHQPFNVPHQPNNYQRPTFQDKFINLHHIHHPLHNPLVSSPPPTPSPSSNVSLPQSCLSVPLESLPSNGSQNPGQSSTSTFHHLEDFLSHSAHPSIPLLSATGLNQPLSQVPQLSLGLRNDSISLGSSPSTSSSTYILCPTKPRDRSSASSQLNSPFSPQSGLPGYQSKPRNELQISLQDSSPETSLHHAHPNSLQSLRLADQNLPEGSVTGGSKKSKRRMRSDSPIDKNILRGFERLKLFETPRIYSRTGFDLMGALARVERRPNPQISLGPVDTSAAIVIVDAKQQDFPIIFATPSFSSMTGYDLEEILGRNCRFLQYQPNDPRHLKQQRTNVSQKLGSPKSKQKSSLNNRPLEKIKHHIFKGEEIQSTLVNYKKDGNAFVNFLTVIPITWNTPEIEYFVGFQVDVVEQTDLIFHQIQSKRYFSHFKSQPTSNSQQKPMPSGSNPYPFATESSPEVNPSGFQKFQEIDSNLNQVSSFYTEHALKRISDPISNLTSLSHKLILGESSDLILAVSLKGRLFYVSHSSEYHLGYTSEELICDNISKICHHTDLTMILRQLKEIGNVADTPIELNFRSIKKDGSLTWMELEGKLHLEPGKGRKYVVVVGRPRQIAQIKWSMIKMLSLKEFWMRLSREALCLYCTGKVEELLSYPVRSIIGRSLIELSQTPEKGLRILEIIHQVQITGEARALKHSLAHRSGRMVPIILTVYPSHPHPLGHMKEFYCQVALDGEDANQSCDPPFSFPGHQSESPSNQPARTTFHPKPLDSNLFSQLETHKTTAWNLELSELKQKNKMLKNEILKRRSERFQ